MKRGSTKGAPRLHHEEAKRGVGKMLGNGSKGYAEMTGGLARSHKVMQHDVRRVNAAAVEQARRNLGVDKRLNRATDGLDRMSKQQPRQAPVKTPAVNAGSGRLFSVGGGVLTTPTPRASVSSKAPIPSAKF